MNSVNAIEEVPTVSTGTVDFDIYHSYVSSSLERYYFLRQGVEISLTIYSPSKTIPTIIQAIVNGTPYNMLNDYLLEGGLYSISKFVGFNDIPSLRSQYSQFTTFISTIDDAHYYVDFRVGNDTGTIYSTEVESLIFDTSRSLQYQEVDSFDFYINNIGYNIWDFYLSNQFSYKTPRCWVKLDGEISHEMRFSSAQNRYIYRHDFGISDSTTHTFEFIAEINGINIIIPGDTLTCKVREQTPIYHCSVGYDYLAFSYLPKEIPFYLHMSFQNWINEAPELTVELDHTNYSISPLESLRDKYEVNNREWIERTPDWRDYNSLYLRDLHFKLELNQIHSLTVWIETRDGIFNKSIWEDEEDEFQYHPVVPSFELSNFNRNITIIDEEINIDVSFQLEIIDEGWTPIEGHIGYMHPMSFERGYYGNILEFSVLSPNLYQFTYIDTSPSYWTLLESLTHGDLTEILSLEFEHENGTYFHFLNTTFVSVDSNTPSPTVEYGIPLGSEYHYDLEGGDISTNPSFHDGGIDGAYTDLTFISSGYEAGFPYIELNSTLNYKEYAKWYPRYADWWVWEDPWVRQNYHCYYDPLVPILTNIYFIPKGAFHVITDFYKAYLNPDVSTIEETTTRFSALTTAGAASISITVEYDSNGVLQVYEFDLIMHDYHQYISIKLNNPPPVSKKIPGFHLEWLCLWIIFGIIGLGILSRNKISKMCRS